MAKKPKHPIIPVPPWKLIREVEKLDDDGRAWAIHQAMVLAFDSLNSHLIHAYKGKDKDFEKRCVQEYATIIHLLSKLY